MMPTNHYWFGFALKLSERVNILHSLHASSDRTRKISQIGIGIPQFRNELAVEHFIRRL